MTRFDEVELLKEPEISSAESLAASFPIVSNPSTKILPGVQRPRARPLPAAPREAQVRTASRFHRAFALLTDLSLFIALGLALTPLLPYRADWRSMLAAEWATVFALTGFLLLLSYYYFVLSWLIWGRTVGAAIFDVRIVSEDGGPMSARSLSRRWAGILLSLLLGGLGFLPALLPRGRSLADRISQTRAIAA